MAELFEPTVINGMTLANRFVRSATWEGLATREGYATEGLTKLLTDLARGKVGLIITSHAYVSPEGQAAPAQLGIYTDGHVPSLKEMVDKVHDAGGRIALQISHGGRYALKFPDVVRVGPSTIESKGEIQCREMTEGEILSMVGLFAEAAQRAKAAGFDAIQIHSAHGYLVSQFLSPYSNKRTDSYGGPVRNRARFLLDVVRAMRNEVGDKFPLLVKLNSQEFLEGGYTVEDMLVVASLLEEAGIDAIEMSGGNHVEGVFGAYFPARQAKPNMEERPYYLDEARRYKERHSGTAHARGRHPLTGVGKADCVGRVRRLRLSLQAAHTGAGADREMAVRGYRKSDVHIGQRLFQARPRRQRNLLHGCGQGA